MRCVVSSRLQFASPTMTSSACPVDVPPLDHAIYNVKYFFRICLILVVNQKETCILFFQFKLKLQYLVKHMYLTI